MTIPQRIWAIVEMHESQEAYWFDKFIVTLISLNLVAFVLETDPDLTDRLVLGFAPLTRFPLAFLRLNWQLDSKLVHLNNDFLASLGGCVSCSLCMD